MIFKFLQLILINYLLEPKPNQFENRTEPNRTGSCSPVQNLKASRKPFLEFFDVVSSLVFGFLTSRSSSHGGSFSPRSFPALQARYNLIQSAPLHPVQSWAPAICGCTLLRIPIEIEVYSYGDPRQRLGKREQHTFSSAEWLSFQGTRYVRISWILFGFCGTLIILYLFF